MKQLMIGVSALLAIVVIAGLFISSRTTASADSDKAEIVSLNQRQLDAFNKKDLDAVMAFYVNDKDNPVFYEDTIPFQLQGASALRKYDQEFFESASQIHWPRIEAISVVVSGDLAAAHYTLPLTWTDRGGTHSVRSRFTQVLKKVNGKWLIWHEHLSVPYDPETGKAVFDAQP
jgi:ketosteroid isomerase-like protein